MLNKKNNFFLLALLLMFRNLFQPYAVNTFPKSTLTNKILVEEYLKILILSVSFLFWFCTVSNMTRLSWEACCCSQRLIYNLFWFLLWDLMTFIMFHAPRLLAVHFEFLSLYSYFLILSQLDIILNLSWVEVLNFSYLER